MRFESQYHAGDNESSFFRARASFSGELKSIAG
jgi:hypothetical protein